MSDTAHAPTLVESARIGFSHERVILLQTRLQTRGLSHDRPSGGARRDRTDDLLLAKQALSQLSYGPFRDRGRTTACRAVARAPQTPAFALRAPARQPSLRSRERRLVGLGRFELPTSRLSSARSNQLSYKPVPGVSNQKTSNQKHDSHLITEYRLLTY